MICIELKNAGLTFRVRKQGRITIKDLLLRGMFRPSKNPCIEVKALKNINVEFREGERIGFLGHNGAGKSTLLKVLAGIYPVTEGEVTVNGRVHSMLDIGVGIEGDANGWDNILYRCLVQGDTPAEAKNKMKAIAEFTELGDALNMPVRFYSSGMSVRLLFSIATTIEPEILLLDEVLGAGDLSFQEKAYRRMMDLIDRARVLILASHDLKSIERLCTRVLWMDHGNIVMEGKPNEVIPVYENYMKEGYKAAA